MQWRILKILFICYIIGGLLFMLYKYIDFYITIVTILTDLDSLRGIKLQKLAEIKELENLRLCKLEDLSKIQAENMYPLNGNPKIAVENVNTNSIFVFDKRIICCMLLGAFLGYITPLPPSARI